ncbi:hypothetical protein I79_003619 [Cricetulus griseus]|uniref:Uncharacterized protein n=1 Tax=Cricetulus griseus TaxID=10029 RepID=G3H0G3_CRIGR|nr:hypothetical protein I79_003619 [Cricetulus griseus]
MGLTVAACLGEDSCSPGCRSMSSPKAEHEPSPRIVVSPTAKLKKKTLDVCGSHSLHSHRLFPLPLALPFRVLTAGTF